MFAFLNTFAQNNSAPKPLFDDPVYHDATIRIGDQWNVYFDKYRDHKHGAVTSTDLLNWKDIFDKISFPEGMRHGTIFRINKKELNVLLAQ